MISYSNILRAVRPSGWRITLLILLSIYFDALAQQGHLTETFDNALHDYPKTGRGIASISSKVLKTKDAYLSFGKLDWKDYEIEFRARVPATADQVQICAGFREADRDDRYFFMLKGGSQKYLYLARHGYMGTDDFLAIRQLDFQPIPGKWYKFKVQVAGSRIRIFLNDEKEPRIDVTDQNSDLLPAGRVTLGGSWISNEFDDLSVKGIAAQYFADTPVKEYKVGGMDKELLRRQQREHYRAVKVAEIPALRSVISLNGNWLFCPGYEISDEDAVRPSSGDSKWHIMKVPEFWTPSRVWLHGEKYNGDSKGVADNYYQKETARCGSYTFDYKKTAAAWYRQWLELPADIRGKKLELSFDAVSKIAEVWVNGKKAGDHTGMFGEFKLDVSRYLKPGKNLIAVKVTKDYLKDIKDADKIAGVAVTVEVTQKMVKDLAHGFFAEDPAGIWQPVSLTVTDPLRIDDVFIRPGLSGANFDITISNNSDRARKLSISGSIADPKDRNTLYDGTLVRDQTFKPGESKTLTCVISGLKPKLWTPEHPNLYDFRFVINEQGRTRVDEKLIRSGFRTFKASGDYLYLNGQRYWLRGGNHTPMPLGPNDTALAQRSSKLMKEGNIMITRTHTVPYTETWMNASDENGIGVSYEGTWPWLFLGTSMPEEKLVSLWRTEFLDLIKKYRNHPSLLIWTVNNEMKFYDNDPDMERTRTKMKIISDVVKEIRRTDPTRPVVFDSNYKRNVRKFGKDFFDHIDDGDIDDVHAYLNWYDFSIFQYFKGEWQKQNKNPGRPLISQEMSTGYTDETGHATRFYNYVHQNPSALAGKFTFEYNDPKFFMKPQAFITKELAEALRRSDPESAGILHFALITWFTNAYSAKDIKPFPVYHDVKLALQPVLISAELWGRHFYAGQKMPVRVCVVNDREDGSKVRPSVLTWKIADQNGKTLNSGEQNVPLVEHYQRKWLQTSIDIPAELPGSKVEGQLILALKESGRIISENRYEVQMSSRRDAGADRLKGRAVTVVDNDRSVISALDFLGIEHRRSADIRSALQQKSDVVIISGIDSSGTGPEDIAALRSFIHHGGRLLLSGSGTLASKLYPTLIRDVLKEDGEVMMMDIPESAVFDGLEPLETRYFNNGKSEMPSVISGAFRINRDPRLQALGSFTKVHGYLEGSMKEKTARLDKLRGFPIIKVIDQGKVIMSEVRVDKAGTDPVAAKLFVNMLNDLIVQ